ncbi:MAG: radical SAM protein [Deltaproteobacteria bacterium]|nr:radical SAM protein [Deltaproteobacteria bacterium]
MTYPLTNLYMGFIERIPFFHFNPGIRSMSIGTYGCNLDCSYCMNQHLLNEPAFFFDLSPAQVVKKAAAADAGIISFSANEPAVSFSYFMDIAGEARNQGILMGCSTNGLFSDSQSKAAAEVISCANISVKGPSTAFYREVCRGGSLDAVLSTISFLHDHGVHIEVTTPYVPLMTRQDMLTIAGKISEISRKIPWHIYRLLPEYHCTDMPHTEINDMIALRSDARALLDYVYLENFPNSIWVDTLCPSCSELVVKRVSSGGCGATLFDIRLNDESCPGCSTPIYMRGQVAEVTEDNDITLDPRKGIIEVGGFRSIIDMSTCLPCELPMEPPLAETITRIPYPGDMKETSDAWVTDMACSFIKELHPDLAVITYSQSSFVGRHREDPETYRHFVDTAGKEVLRLIEQTGYEYLVVGLGDMIPSTGIINLEKEIEGIASADEGIACLYKSSRRDVERLKNLDGIDKIYTREDLGDMIGYRFDPDIYGEYFLIPEQGYRFLALSSISRFSYRTDSLDVNLPVYSTIPVPEHITGIRKAVSETVLSGNKTLLIILDGVGTQVFPFEFTSISNSSGPLKYASSLHQYMVLSTGEPICPHFFAYPHWMNSPRINPFTRHSPYLKSCLTHDIMDAGKVAVSIGNRSILTHSAFPAHVSVECHCSALHHYGTLEVIQ